LKRHIPKAKKKTSSKKIAPVEPEPETDELPVGKKVGKDKMREAKEKIGRKWLDAFAQDSGQINEQAARNLAQETFDAGLELEEVLPVVEFNDVTELLAKCGWVPKTMEETVDDQMDFAFDDSQDDAEDDDDQTEIDFDKDEGYF
jgi:hypothetical protein